MTVKISALPAAASAAGTDELETNQAGTSRKVTEAQIATYIFSAKTTANLTENTNLYYTQARFDTAFAAKTTADLAENTNLYYTAARFNTAFGGKSTTDLTEGTNLYYTQARFDTAFAAKTTSNLTEGSNKYLTYANFVTALLDNHLKSGQTVAPTILQDANAGTGASASISGNDIAGSITLTTGTVAWASGSQVAVTFNAAFGTAPKVALTPTNANAAAATLSAYVTKTTTTLTINFVAADVAQTTYTWDYICYETL